MSSLNNTIRFFAVCALFVSVVGILSVSGQPTPPDDPNSAPIDGGLMLLLGAGASAGAWKYRAAAKAKRP